MLEKPGEYEVVLAEDGVEAHIVGLFKAVDKEKIDCTVIIRHQASRTKCETTLKGVGRDKSQIRFVGRIIIEENLSQVSSFLTERILLLSDQAKAEAIPDLEIKSSDVKCSHAASISTVSSEQIFYLMSRGITRPQAEEMIEEGFLGL